MSQLDLLDDFDAADRYAREDLLHSELVVDAIESLVESSREMGEDDERRIETSAANLLRLLEKINYAERRFKRDDPFISVSDLSRWTRMSPRTVQRAKNGLIAHGLLEVERRSLAGARAADAYRVNWSALHELCRRGYVRVAVPPPRHGDTTPRHPDTTPRPGDTGGCPGDGGISINPTPESLLKPPPPNPRTPQGDSWGEVEDRLLSLGEGLRIAPDIVAELSVSPRGPTPRFALELIAWYCDQAVDGVFPWGLAALGERLRRLRPRQRFERLWPERSPEYLRAVKNREHRERMRRSASETPARSQEPRPVDPRLADALIDVDGMSHDERLQRAREHLSRFEADAIAKTRDGPLPDALKRKLAETVLDQSSPSPTPSSPP